MLVPCVNACYTLCLCLSLNIPYVDRSNDQTNSSRFTQDSALEQGVAWIRTHPLGSRPWSGLYSYYPPLSGILYGIKVQADFLFVLWGALNLHNASHVFWSALRFWAGHYVLCNQSNPSHLRSWAFAFGDAFGGVHYEEHGHLCWVVVFLHGVLIPHYALSFNALLLCRNPEAISHCCSWEPYATWFPLDLNLF